MVLCTRLPIVVDFLFSFSFAFVNIYRYTTQNKAELLFITAREILILFHDANLKSYALLTSSDQFKFTIISHELYSR